MGRVEGKVVVVTGAAEMLTENPRRLLARAG
jgi:hypothetical protein